jgi:hypothetical protein
MVYALTTNGRVQRTQIYSVTQRRKLVRSAATWLLGRDLYQLTGLDENRSRNA